VAIKASGKTQIIELTDAQKTAWRKAMQPVYKEMEGRVGKELIAAIQREAAAVGYR
jgi:C4-dicarboxylate-binding protein DctP